MSGYQVVVGDGHLADELLMQLLDDMRVTPETRNHLAGCPRCSTRYAAIERAAALLRASLPDVPMPRIDLRAARKRRHWVIPVPIAIAATLILMASAAAATPPVRHWIMQRLRPTAAPATVTPPVTATPSRDAGLVASFAPGDTTLVIRVDRRQRTGTLTLAAAPGDRVSAQTTNGSNGEELFVTPTQIRIANDVGSVADYRITLPASVRVIRVLIAGVEVTVRNDANLDRRLLLR